MPDSPSTLPLHSDLERYLVALDELDRTSALEVMETLTGRALPADQIVRGLLAPAQVEVGRLWQTAQRSVAWEHAATAITEEALFAVAGRASVEPDRDGVVLLVCAEGEGHELPARMTCALMRLHGVDPVFVGSLQGALLAEFLARRPVRALGVSCTMTAHLAGALHTIATAHRAGVPVIAGGAAFGTDGARARHLGAEAWTGDPAEAVAISRRLEGPGQPPPEPAAHPELPHLTVGADDLAAAAMVGLAREYRDWPADWSEADAARQDFTHVIALCASALVLNELRILTEGIAWRREYWSARSEPQASLVLRLEALADALRARVPRAAGMLDAALAAL